MNDLNFKKILFLFSLVIIFPTLSKAAPCETSGCVQKIDSLEKFHELGYIERAKFGIKERVSVKIVYDQENDQFYYMNTKLFDNHDTFIKDELKILNYSERNYYIPGTKRKLLAATIDLWITQNENFFLLEVDGIDVLKPHYIHKIYNKIKQTAPGVITQNNFYYHPLTPQQEQQLSDWFKEDSKRKGKLKIKTNVDLLKGVSFIPYSKERSVGVLKLWNENECFDNTHIIIYDQVPNTALTNAGVISKKMQTRLSHVNLMSKKNKVFNAYMKDADQKLNGYIGKKVEIGIKDGKFFIKELGANADTIVQNFWKKRRGQIQWHPKKPKKEINDIVILPKVLEGSNDVLVYRNLTQNIGAKASNVALAGSFFPKVYSQFTGTYYPEGIALPFSFFDEFMTSKVDGQLSVNDKIEKIIKSENLFNKNSFCEVKGTLKKIRKVIKSGKVPENHLLNIKKHLIDNESSPIHISKIPKIRLRSSSNAEDDINFLGAGLYKSKGLWLYDKKNGKRQRSLPRSWGVIKKKLEKKIPQVYASIWSDKAFNQRLISNFTPDNHRAVKMGVLIHQAFPKNDLDGNPYEVANGVAITYNIFNPYGDKKMYINSQHGDFSVTNPPSREELKKHNIKEHEYQTEEILLNWYPDDRQYMSRPDNYKFLNYKILNHSSLSSERVLRDVPAVINDRKQMELRLLGRALRELTDRYNNFMRTEGTPLEVEFKIIGKNKRHIWIKQLRPIFP